MNINLPLNDKTIEKLHAGEILYLNGTIYTARDAAHQRLVKTLAQDQPIPIDLGGQTIYYAGPCPAPNNHIIGAVGPTTSQRMDIFVEPLLEQGLKAMIGKGPRSVDVERALQKHKAVYMVACGGAGALLAKRISKMRVVAYHDLGTEAIRSLTVEKFPVIVANDIYGASIFR